MTSRFQHLHAYQTLVTRPRNPEDASIRLAKLPQAVREPDVASLILGLAYGPSRSKATPSSEASPSAFAQPVSNS